MSNRKPAPKPKPAAPRRSRARLPGQTEAPEVAQVKARLLDALTKCHGVKSAACDLVGVSRVTLNNYERSDQAFAAAVADLALVERKKDFAEYALLKLVAKGHPAAVIFANKCLNQDRGYLERQQIDHHLPGPFVIERAPEPAPPPAPRS